jgi:hypothetical protein
MAWSHRNTQWYALLRSMRIRSHRAYHTCPTELRYGVIVATSKMRLRTAEHVHQTALVEPRCLAALLAVGCPRLRRRTLQAQHQFDQLLAAQGFGIRTTHNLHESAVSLSREGAVNYRVPSSKPRYCLNIGNGYSRRLLVVGATTLIRMARKKPIASLVGPVHLNANQRRSLRLRSPIKQRALMSRIEVYAASDPRLRPRCWVTLRAGWHKNYWVVMTNRSD